MVLGFAVVAVFAVAVFSTIIATVSEMNKPIRPDESALAMALVVPPNGSIGFDQKEFDEHEKENNGEVEGYVSMMNCAILLC
jgi:hypothetical protein